MSNADLPSQIRDLVRRARESTPKLSLFQISDMCGVRYDALWRFTRAENPSNTLRLDEADNILTILAKYLDGK